MLTVLEAEAAFAAIKLQLLATMEERQVVQHATGLNTANWLNGTTVSSPAAAYREARLANGLHRRFPAILRAMVRGAVSAEQAAAIVEVLKKLPESLDRSGRRSRGDDDRIRRRARPEPLRDLATYLLDMIAPEIAEATEAAQLDAQDRGARKNQYLRLRDDGDGCTTITGKLPAADGEALRAVVEAIANSAKTAQPDASWAEAQPKRHIGVILAVMLGGLLAGVIVGIVAAVALLGVVGEGPARPDRGGADREPARPDRRAPVGGERVPVRAVEAHPVGHLPTPRLAAPMTLHEAQDSYGRPFAILHTPATATYSVVLACDPGGSGA